LSTKNSIQTEQRQGFFIWSVFRQTQTEKGENDLLQRCFCQDYKILQDF
jgi:hypothetical protein